MISWFEWQGHKENHLLSLVSTAENQKHSKGIHHGMHKDDGYRNEWTRWEYPHGTGIEFHKATCTSTPGSHIGQNHGCLKLQLLIILR